jgi:hypothetical protein
MKKSKMKFASGGSVRDRISMAIGDAVDRLRGTTYEPNPPQKEVRRAANIREVEDRAVSKKAGGVIRKRYADGGFVTDDDNPDDQYVDRGDRGPDLAAMAKATPAPAKPKPKARKRGAEFGRENAASRDRSLGSSAQWRAGERGSKAMEDYKVLANAGDWAKKKGYKAGGVVRSRDGCAVRGKTKGRMV